MKTTMFDPHWDPRLRRLIHRHLLERQAIFSDTALFEQAHCTTLEAAKALLTEEPSFLQSYPEAQRAAAQSSRCNRYAMICLKKRLPPTYAAAILVRPVCCIC
jgi:hypothetical protein